ncbi:MAG: class I SAM-dependent methyltransferase [Alphaproteobacteria bacterium]|nr:class I SAM-dependent methyltransferase [Alphaproteobacteria bacterium]
MFYVSLTREAVLELMPKGGTVCEIGVAEGDFSAAILARAAPRRLHLIDPWEKQPVDDGGLDPNNLEQPAQESRYARVQRRFAAEVAAGTVTIHRGYSQDVVGQFADGSLDWIYIDGSHLYEHVSADLRLYAPKVKPDGLIFGDDHVSGGMYDRMKFGVVPAVRDFLRETKYHFSLLNASGQFLIAKEPNAPDHLSILVRALSANPFFIEIHDPEQKDIKHVIGELTNGKAVYFLSV